MILDSSALIALIFKEPGHGQVMDKLTGSEYLGIGTPTLAETGIVLTARMGHLSNSLLVGLLQELGINEIPFGPAHWREAVDAYQRFGRRRHPARLNFGDCLSYATAKLAGQPLLFIGHDFSQTDIEQA
jgi:ribonuclease VapC